MTVKEPDGTVVINEYAGLYVHRSYQPDSKDAFVVGDRREGGVNIMPGATWFHTREEALQAIDIYRVVDGDSQKFWHLLRAIAREGK